jgi:hypothetical protein
VLTKSNKDIPGFQMDNDLAHAFNFAAADQQFAEAAGFDSFDDYLKHHYRSQEPEQKPIIKSPEHLAGVDEIRDRFPWLKKEEQ